MYYAECNRLFDENGRDVGTSLNYDVLNECKK